MTRPYLSIDLDKIERNTAAITRLCGRHGIAVAGVTKCVCGHPQVARAMLRGGVVSLADSRLENIDRLRGAGIEADCLLLRLPALSGAAQVVESADWSVNSELAVLQALSRAAIQHRRVHQVMLMVDLGDLREGIWPDDLLALAAQAIRLPGIRIVGLGTNLACFSGVVPSEHNMQRLVELAEALEQRLALRLDWVSGVNSSGLELIASGLMAGGALMGVFDGIVNAVIRYTAGGATRWRRKAASRSTRGLYNAGACGKPAKSAHSARSRSRADLAK